MRALFLFLALAFQAFNAHAAADGIVAVVSTTVITTQELAQRTALMERQLSTESKLTEADKKFIQNKSLMMLIDEELQRQFAVANGVSVTPAELQNYRNAVAQQVDLDKLATGAGMANTLKRKLESEVRWQKIVAQLVQPRVYIPPSEIDQLITGMLKGKHVNEREISQILLAVTDKSDEENQHQKIEQLAEKLKAGAKFDELAKQYSDDDSGKKGGKMGWFATGELNPQLEESLDKLEKGQISGIIRTPLGWHLIRLDDIRETKPLENNEESIAKYRERVRDHLTASRVELEARKLMREMRQRAFVDIRK